MKITQKEWKLILIALETMEETHKFIRGFGKINEEEGRFQNLIKKIKANSVKIVETNSDIGGILPEHLPTEKHIKEVKKEAKQLEGMGKKKIEGKKSKSP